MRGKLWTAICFAFISVGITASLYADSQVPLGYGSVIFMITDTSGNPVSDVSVSLFDTILKVSQPSITTDEKGKAVRHNLINHRFKITLEKSDYVTQEQMVQVAAGIKWLVTVTMETEDEAFMKALPDNPQVHAVYFYNKAVRFYRELQYGDAIHALEQSLEKRPDFVKAHFLKGWIHYRQRRDQEAIASLEKVTELDSRHVTTYRILADIYIRGHQRALSEKYTALAIEIGGATAVDKFNEAVKHFNTGEVALAVPAFESAVSKNPRMADAYYHLGICYLHGGERQKAGDVLKRYLELAETGRYAKQARSALKSLGRR